MLQLTTLSIHQEHEGKSQNESSNMKGVQWMNFLNINEISKEKDSCHFSSDSPLTQIMQEALHIEWKADIDTSDHTIFMEEFAKDCTHFFWQIELILDCMNANQNVILGRTETIKINLKSKSSLFQENESFEVKIPGEAFPKQDPQKLGLSNISLLRMSLIGTNNKDQKLVLANSDLVVNILQDSKGMLLRRIYSPFQ